MKSIISLVSIGVSLLSTFALLPSPTIAKDKPDIDHYTFEHALSNLFYFADSDILLAHDGEGGTVHRSDDAGKSWTKIDDDGQAGKVLDVWPHPFNDQRAYLLTEGTKHWMTKDRGKTWKSFDTESRAAFFRRDPLKFHGRDPKKVIWNGFVNSREASFYTDDDFETVHKLGEKTRGCEWAVGRDLYGLDVAEKIDKRVFCIREGFYSSWPKDNRFMVSDDYFKDHEIEAPLDNGRALSGVISTAAVKKYFVAAVKSEGTRELALYVTDDATHWHRAEFGSEHKVEEDAYTILESTNYSMQIDVLGQSKMGNPMGHLFTSNSNGTYFTKNIDYTNRNPQGRVDFEKVQNIQGIVLVNTVENSEEVLHSVFADKQIITKISFDDGRNFENIKADGETLHLHSVTEAVQGGRVFSSPAPGIVMGIGNTGKYLKRFEDGDLFVSDDAGRTWRKALNGPHLYEFGNNGAILVAIRYKESTKTLKYSLNHGRDWKEVELEDKVRFNLLTTVPDSTTRKFLMLGITGSSDKERIFRIDFDGLHERTCADKDFEKWPARVDDDGKASCIMGHKQYFTRRKADADCFIEQDFKDPTPELETCVCTEEDFECDFNFKRDPDDRKKCLPVEVIKAPDGQCKEDGDTFKGPSGWRLIPGNDCNRKGGIELDKEIERSCKDTLKAPVSGEISHLRTDFHADYFEEWYYLEKSVTGTDETIVMRNSEQEVYITHNHGKEWKQILKGKPIVSIVPNHYHHDIVYFLTSKETVYYSINRGEQIEEFAAKVPPTQVEDIPILKFHPDYKDWLLWAGTDGKIDQAANMYYTENRGDRWDLLTRSVRKCEYIHRGDEKKLIFCEKYENEDPKTKNVQLVSSNNFFADYDTHFDRLIDFATMEEFIVVAAKAADEKSLKVDTSVDGKVFAEAHFPRNFQPEHQQSYTVLDSSTHAIFLHVNVNPRKKKQYGSIIKSNSNGTDYVLVISAVNQDDNGYVDFEKMQGLEGVAMVNVVSNVEEVDGGANKQLKTMITHNDGSQWALLPPPKKDAVGGDYDCVDENNKATPKCSLHIHHYTERLDKTATFSSPSAVGLMMAVGNVGEFLGLKDGTDTDTFITRDAGITWKSVKKGSYMWEYGDQGSVIVIVREGVATRTIFYTLDEGDHWTEYEFSDVDMTIDFITTVPSDTSLNFLLWGRLSSKNGLVITINLDFTQLSERQRACDLKESDPESGDYVLWEPRHPAQDSNCLFGHVAQYHRKRIDAECYNGVPNSNSVTHVHNILRNCTCIREDFECDYNFELQSDETCKLVEGLQPADHLQFCKENPDQTEFWQVTGYRRIPISTCEGGQELDKIEVLPCPGHEEEFRKKHGIGGVALFFAIVFPIGIACGVGYWVWQRYQAYGFGGFGQIRLGDGMGSTSSSSGQSPFIAIPVAIIAGAWAVVKAIPLLGSSLFRSAKGYMPVGSRTNYSSGPYRSRDAFSRPQNYSTAAYVEDDELLGDEDEIDGDEV